MPCELSFASHLLAVLANRSEAGTGSTQAYFEGCRPSSIFPVSSSSVPPGSTIDCSGVPCDAEEGCRGGVEGPNEARRPDASHPSLFPLPSFLVRTPLQPSPTLEIHPLVSLEHHSTPYSWVRERDSTLTSSFPLFSLQVCSKTFKRPQDLKKHERIHLSSHSVSPVSFLC